MEKRKSRMHLPTIDDLFTTEEERQSADLEKVINIKLDEIDDFPEHPFKIVINDEMQEIYDYIQISDNILIASPIYFSELTGKLLDVGSRLQTYFCATFFRKEKPIAKSKKGAVVLVGGGDGNMRKPYETACTLLHHMNCYNIHDVVFSHNTNVRPAIEDEQVLNGIHSIIDFFNDAQ